VPAQPPTLVYLETATTNELVPLVWPIDESAAGLVLDFGEEANPDLVALRDELEEELLWLVLQRLREQGA
jgi:hypothetical protein